MLAEEIHVTPEDRSFHHQLLLDGAEASGLWVVDRQMRIGGTEVRMGGIAGVGTGRQHRNRGYARRVLHNSTDWMIANGFDCAMLFGIPDFYHRFGYAVCLPDCRYNVLTRDAERAAPTLTVRPLTPEDGPAILEIYTANNAMLTGSIVRDAQTPLFPKGSEWGSGVDAVVFTDDRDTVQAYAARDADRDWLRISELGVRHERYAPDVVRWAAERAVDARYEKVSFLTPPDSPFSIYLTQYGAEQQITYHRNSDGMGRLLNLRSFFAKTLPEWTRRAQSAPALQDGDALRLETDIGAITLLWTGEAMELGRDETVQGVITLPQSRLMQVAMGYYGAETALAFPDVKVTGDWNLMQTLFPRRLPYMWVTDHF
jgi:hypothetical protein